MRICFTCENFPPYWQSGPGRRIYETAKILAKKNEVHVYCNQQLGAPKNEVMDSIFVHRVGFNATPEAYFKRIFSSTMLLFHLLFQNFDIINTSTFFSSFPSYIIAKSKRIPVIFSSDGLLWNINLLNTKRSYKKKGLLFNIARFIERFIFKLNYDSWIAYSKTIKNELIKIGVDKEKIFLVNRGVDLVFFDSIKVKKTNKPTIAFIGVLSQKKGIIDLINAFSIVVREKSKAILIIAGDGPEKNKIIKRISELKISENVDFLGAVSYLEAAKVVKLSDCLVVPGIIEGLCLTILEAQACKKPVIAYETSPSRELIINGFNGFLVPLGNVNQLAKKIITILNNSNLKNKMGKNARKIVEKKCSWENTAKKNLEIFTKVIEEKQN